MTIDAICTLLIDSLKDAGYNNSTIFNYQGVVRRFKAFCCLRRFPASRGYRVCLSRSCRI